MSRSLQDGPSKTPKTPPDKTLTFQQKRTITKIYVHLGGKKKGFDFVKVWKFAERTLVRLDEWEEKPVNQRVNQEEEDF